MDPTQKFVRGSGDADALGASCSNRTVFINLSGCSSPAASDPLLPTWMSLIPLNLLLDLGLLLDAATDFVIELIGDLLAHLAVSHHIVDTVRSTHNAAWFELRG